MYDKMRFEVRSYYTLGGRQTAHPSKGVHVKDAKKVVIR